MNTRIEVCEKHGEYEQREEISPFAGLFEGSSQTMWKGCCAQCLEDNSNKREQEENDKAAHNHNNRRKNAGISIRNLGKTFDDYVCESGTKQEIAKRKFMKLSESMKDGNGFNIIACGGVGTGKTLLSCALVDSICDNRRARIITLMDLVRELKETWKRDSEFSERDAIDYYTKLDLLVIDEIGVQFGSETERLFIFDIINGRYENVKPTVLLSNLSIEMVKEIVGERVIDRLRDDGGQLVVFDWDSARGKK